MLCFGVQTSLFTVRTCLKELSKVLRHSRESFKNKLYCDYTNDIRWVMNMVPVFSRKTASWIITHYLQYTLFLRFVKSPVREKENYNLSMWRRCVMSNTKMPHLRELMFFGKVF